MENSARQVVAARPRRCPLTRLRNLVASGNVVARDQREFDCHGSKASVIRSGQQADCGNRGRRTSRCRPAYCQTHKTNRCPWHAGDWSNWNDCSLPHKTIDVQTLLWLWESRAFRPGERQCCFTNGSVLNVDDKGFYHRSAPLENPVRA